MVTRSLYLCILTFLSYYNLIESQSQLPLTIKGPSTPSDWNNWYLSNIKFRNEQLSSVNYNASIYNVPELQWIQNAYILPQMYPFDKYFYNKTTQSYTIDKWLSYVNNQYGGVDGILYWATYTNIGIDDRNQQQMYYSLPGGVQTLINITNYLHKQNIKIIYPYNPWDTGTNYSGYPEYQSMVSFLNQVNGDGLFGDCMNYIPQQFYTYSVNTYNRPIAMYPEQGGSFPINTINYDTMDFAEWDVTGKNPLLSMWKWLEPRHQSNFYYATKGYDTNGLQTVFFNAIGYSTTQGLFWCYQKIVPRDAQQIKIISSILRYFGAPNRRIVQSIDMKPFIPIFPIQNVYENVFANQFSIDQDTLFLIINRGQQNMNNVVINFNNTWNTNVDKLHIYDCYYGKELSFNFNSVQNIINLTFNIEANGYGAIYATLNTTNIDTKLETFLNSMKSITTLPLLSYSNEYYHLQQKMVDFGETKLYSEAPDNNMVTIPFGIFYFNVSGVEIEGSSGPNNCVDVQYDFEMNSVRSHHQYMTINKFFIDKYTVTCQEYQLYLNQSKYRPKNKYNYLKNWKYDINTDTYTYPNGYSNKPVTYIGIEEARLYCRFYGKRLPHSFEWQYAAQGNTTYLYPWGNEANAGINYPQTQHGRNIPGAANVDEFVPKGDSIFGVSDLIGNVWQYTDQFDDEHTSYAVLRGSSNYYPITTPEIINWYFPNATQLNQEGRYFLMDNSWERAGTLGFRCVADSIQPSIVNNTPFNWISGNGYYCNNGTNDNDHNIILCGSIQYPLGYNNLTSIGNVDWTHFGLNSNANADEWHVVRKKQNSDQQMVITNFTVKTGGSTNKNIYVYDDNINGFYWNNGNVVEYDVLTINNASLHGIYIASVNDAGFQFSLNNLIKGNIYKIRIFVGVYNDDGYFKAGVNIGSKEYVFEDQTVTASNHEITENLMYELIIDLSSIKSSNDDINVLIQWLIKNGNGNITLQSIAVEQINVT
eukprot:322125_1